jgi:precorrin-6Y C5,15-methyltransferase (decarboxylating)
VASSQDRIYIIGVGSDGAAGLTSRGREILLSAELVLGSDQALDWAGKLSAEKLRLSSDPYEMIRTLENNLGRKRMVIVATGDPLFYGIARFLCDRLGKDQFEVLPHVSTMQLAFARVKESWEEAFLTNLANHPLVDVLDRIRVADTVGLFTTELEDPPAIARQLLAHGLDYFRACVCENLGGPDERVTQGELAEIQEMEFAPLNVMILRHQPGRPDRQRTPLSFRRFGNPDDVFAQSRPRSGLITQAEVRALALSLLDVQPGTVVWDIGAGSGSVAIEAARLAEPGMVYAVEEMAPDYHLLLANAATFGVKNLKAVHGSAPAVFANLPAPDAVFVGGIGPQVAHLIEAAYRALKSHGRLVINVASLEMLGSVYGTLKSLTRPVQALLVNLARGVEQLETIRFEAVNPTFLLWVQKP